MLCFIQGLHDHGEPELYTVVKHEPFWLILNPLQFGICLTICLHTLSSCPLTVHYLLLKLCLCFFVFDFVQSRIRYRWTPMTMRGVCDIPMVFTRRSRVTPRDITYTTACRVYVASTTVDCFPPITGPWHISADNSLFG